MRLVCLRELSEGLPEGQSLSKLSLVAHVPKTYLVKMTTADSTVMLDTRIYDTQLPDGSTEQHTSNKIVESL